MGAGEGAGGDVFGDALAMDTLNASRQRTTMFGGNGRIVHARIKRDLHGLTDETFGSGDIEAGTHIRRTQNDLQAKQQGFDRRRRPVGPGIKGGKGLFIAAPDRAARDIENIRFRQNGGRELVLLFEEGVGTLPFEDENVAAGAGINGDPLLDGPAFNGFNQHVRLP